MQRRHFLGLAATAALGSRFSHAVHAFFHAPIHAPIHAPKSTPSTTSVLPPNSTLSRLPLWRPPELRPDRITLRANTHAIASGPATTGTAMTLGTGAIGPTLRVRRGERARITLENALPEPTILHWHGLRVPEAADGHPRLAIATGARYEYDFTVDDRAGTYWYHAHPHHRTGEQVYRGMAGLLIVDDDEESALGLPSGAREIPLLLQDRRIGADGDFVFAPMGHERMEGFFGDVAFGNGTREPTVNVDSAMYRLRVVNVTSARITRLALSTGAPMTLIGVDGGLLSAPVQVEYIDLGTGERADLLVDFSGLPVGTRVMLKSLAFPPPYRGMGGMGGGGMGGGMGGMMGGAAGQGTEMDLLEFTVTRAVRERAWEPRPFPVFTLPERTQSSRTREFRFQSMRMQHTINGREFEMERVDERVPFGSTEIWRFVNESQFPHPVHMHEVQFRILSRTGGRNALFPWEQGLKDTVLLFPGETVEVVARFDAYRGMFLMHCHNLVHEDMGMMMNYVIE
jgi:FtsP/CotA-like multicopper oxidase with cupredoxin domain